MKKKKKPNVASFAIDLPLHNRLKKHARSKRRSLSSWLCIAAEEKLDREDPGWRNHHQK